MKILKPGKTLNKSQTIYFICYHCDCEYSCDTTEPICKKYTDNESSIYESYIYYGIVHYGTFYECNCPNCNCSNTGMDYQQYLKYKNG